ncbi:hypothetical protein EJB05_39494, partial [Eragrostis curvula]
MGVDPVTHQRLPPDDVLLASSPEGLLRAAASLRDLDSALRQAQALQLLLQLAMNNLPQTAGYPANVAEQGMLAPQSSASSPCSSNDVVEPANQYCNNTATLERPAYPPQEVAAEVVLPAAVQGFTDLLEPVEMPSLYSAEEEDAFWKDMLDSSFRL